MHWLERAATRWRITVLESTSNSLATVEEYEMRLYLPITENELIGRRKSVWQELAKVDDLSASKT